MRWEDLNRFECQPCDHKWWQHRNPDPGLRLLGVAMMFIGAFQVGIGLAILLHR